MSMACLLPYFIVLVNEKKREKKYIFYPEITWNFRKMALKTPKECSMCINFMACFYSYSPQNSLSCSKCALYFSCVWISKNECKPCEFTREKKLRTFRLFFKAILRMKMLKYQKLKNMQCLKTEVNWFLKDKRIIFISCTHNMPPRLYFFFPM